MKTLSRITVLTIITIILSGCIFVPMIDSVKQSGVLQGDRENLLPTAVKTFHEAIYWRKDALMMAMVHPENLEEVKKTLPRGDSEQRFVDSKITEVNFSNGSYDAVVNVQSKSFTPPFYVVETHLEKETWKFSISNGWMLHGREVKKKV